ncbi:MAG: transcriptional regulator, partial [Dokdonella sp.]
MSRPTYAFGDCTLDPATRELHRAGKLVALSPKVFDCIAYLLGHRERAVGRDELAAAVWGKADVTDSMLGQVVVKARRVVGDTGGEQDAIRTIPRFGYRWVAPVETASMSVHETDAKSAAEDDAAAAQSPARGEPIEPPIAQATVAMRAPDQAPPEPAAAARPNDRARAQRTSAAVPRRRWLLALLVALAAFAAIAGAWHEFDSRRTRSIGRSVAALARHASDAVAVLPV